VVRSERLGRSGGESGVLGELVEGVLVGPGGGAQHGVIEAGVVSR
jgi:hypothetical protein